MEQKKIHEDQLKDERAHIRKEIFIALLLWYHHLPKKQYHLFLVMLAEFTGI